MADALASGASVRKGVGVQIPPRARVKTRASTMWSGPSRMFLAPSDYGDEFDFGLGLILDGLEGKLAER